MRMCSTAKSTIRNIRASTVSQHHTERKRMRQMWYMVDVIRLKLFLFMEEQVFDQFLIYRKRGFSPNRCVCRIRLNADSRISRVVDEQ